MPTASGISISQMGSGLEESSVRLTHSASLVTESVVLPRRAWKWTRSSNWPTFSMNTSGMPRDAGAIRLLPDGTTEAGSCDSAAVCCAMLGTNQGVGTRLTARANTVRSKVTIVRVPFAR